MNINASKRVFSFGLSVSVHAFWIFRLGVKKDGQHKNKSYRDIPGDWNQQQTNKIFMFCYQCLHDLGGWASLLSRKDRTLTKLLEIYSFPVKFLTVVRMFIQWWVQLAQWINTILTLGLNIY